MLRNYLSLNEGIVALENALLIESTSLDVEEISIQAIRKLESRYQVHLIGRPSVYNQMATDVQAVAPLEKLTKQVIMGLQQLTMFTCLAEADHKIGQSLPDLNYLGQNREELRIALKYLTNVSLLPQAEVVIKVLVDGASKCEKGDVKRLITCINVLHKLGMTDGVALVGQYLYKGMQLG